MIDHSSLWIILGVWNLQANIKAFSLPLPKVVEIWYREHAANRIWLEADKGHIFLEGFLWGPYTFCCLYSLRPWAIGILFGLHFSNFPDNHVLQLHYFPHQMLYLEINSKLCRPYGDVGSLRRIAHSPRRAALSHRLPMPELPDIEKMVPIQHQLLPLHVPLRYNSGGSIAENNTSVCSKPHIYTWEIRNGARRPQKNPWMDSLDDGLDLWLTKSGGILIQSLYREPGITHHMAVVLSSPQYVLLLHFFILLRSNIQAWISSDKLELWRYHGTHITRGMMRQLSQRGNILMAFSGFRTKSSKLSGNGWPSEYILKHCGDEKCVCLAFRKK